MIVNFGCGANPAPDDSSYVNIDGSLTVRLARLPLPATAFGSRADFVRVIRANRIHYGTARHLEFPNDSLDGFYASHVLEHLSTADCEDLVSRVRCWLKPSGVLRVVLPDLKRTAQSYVAGEIDASRFIAGTYLAANSLHWWEIVFGHSRHRWMYDAASFTQLLQKLDFGAIQECKMHQGLLPALSCLDIPSRESESFYVEACK